MLVRRRVVDVVVVVCVVPEPEEPVVPELLAVVLPDEPESLAVLPDDPVVPELFAVLPDDPVVPELFAVVLPDDPVVPVPPLESLVEPVVLPDEPGPPPLAVPDEPFEFAVPELLFAVVPDEPAVPDSEFEPAVPELLAVAPLFDVVPLLPSLPELLAVVVVEPLFSLLPSLLPPQAPSASANTADITSVAVRELGNTFFVMIFTSASGRVDLRVLGLDGQIHDGAHDTGIPHFVRQWLCGKPSIGVCEPGTAHQTPMLRGHEIKSVWENAGRSTTARTIARLPCCPPP